MRPDAEKILRALVGRDDVALRDDQWAAIEALVVEHRRALVVQRTGWGKSAVYFVATGLLRAQGAGPTLIVSPLLALMRNQVEAAARAGISAHTINSANTEEWEAVEEALRTGSVDVLLVSPERLNNPDFRDRLLPPLAARIGLLVVDEAHCISDWGHDFRPDYRRIREALSRLRPDIPVLATTATANQRVVDDVADQLAVGADGTRHDVLVLRGSLERDSLRLGVLRLTRLRPAAGVAGRAPRRAAGQRHHLHPDGGRGRGPRRVPARRRPRRRRLLRAHRHRRAARRRGGARREPGEGARGDLGARHGLRQARPRLRRARRRAAVADRLLPAGGAGRARRRAGRRAAAAGARGRGDLALLRLPRLPGGGPRAADARRAGAPPDARCRRRRSRRAPRCGAAASR